MTSWLCQRGVCLTAPKTLASNIGMSQAGSQEHFLTKSQRAQTLKLSHFSGPATSVTMTTHILKKVIMFAFPHNAAPVKAAYIHEFWAWDDTAKVSDAGAPYKHMSKCSPSAQHPATKACVSHLNSACLLTSVLLRVWNSIEIVQT